MKKKSKKVISVDISDDDDISVMSVSDDDDTCAMSVDISDSESVSSNSDTGSGGNEGGIRESRSTNKILKPLGVTRRKDCSTYCRGSNRIIETKCQIESCECHIAATTDAAAAAAAAAATAPAATAAATSPTSTTGTSTIAAPMPSSSNGLQVATPTYKYILSYR